jgi:hypothetical protein
MIEMNSRTRGAPGSKFPNSRQVLGRPQFSVHVTVRAPSRENHSPTEYEHRQFEADTPTVLFETI